MADVRDSDELIGRPGGGNGGGDNSYPIKDAYISLYGRNISLLGPFVEDGEGGFKQMTAYFHAHKVYITVEEEQVYEKKLITGEILTRWKKRRQIELEIAFFGRFNQFENETRPGYAEFETIINAEDLRFVYYGTTKEYPLHSGFNTIPYSEPDVNFMGAPIPVILKEKKIEYLNGLIGKKIVKLTLWERYNWYTQ